MTKIHLIMPMAGGGSRFRDKGFEVPKPLIEIHGKPFFYWAAQSILQNIACIDVTFVVLENHVENYKIDNEIHKFFPDAKIKIIPEILPGAVCTCLKGVEDIEDTAPVIFNDCDHLFACGDLAERLPGDQPVDFDGALITFNSSEPHFSYVKFDEFGNVTGTVEKQVVSNCAICGAYFFRNAKLFRQMSERYFKTCNYKEYFMSGVYNELFKAGKKIVNFNADFYLAFGTPQEYKDAKKSLHFDDIQVERKIKVIVPSAKLIPPELQSIGKIPAIVYPINQSIAFDFFKLKYDGVVSEIDIICFENAAKVREMLANYKLTTKLKLLEPEKLADIGYSVYQGLTDNDGEIIIHFADTIVMDSLPLNEPDFFCSSKEYANDTWTFYNLNDGQISAVNDKKTPAPPFDNNRAKYNFFVGVFKLSNGAYFKKCLEQVWKNSTPPHIMTAFILRWFYTIRLINFILMKLKIGLISDTLNFISRQECRLRRGYSIILKLTTSAEF